MLFMSILFLINWLLLCICTQKDGCLFLMLHKQRIRLRGKTELRVEKRLIYFVRIWQARHYFLCNNWNLICFFSLFLHSFKTVCVAQPTAHGVIKWSLYHLFTTQKLKKDSNYCQIVNNTIHTGHKFIKGNNWAQIFSVVYFLFLLFYYFLSF